MRAIFASGVLAVTSAVNAGPALANGDETRTLNVRHPMGAAATPNACLRTFEEYGHVWVSIEEQILAREAGADDAAVAAMEAARNAIGYIQVIRLGEPAIRQRSAGERFNTGTVSDRPWAECTMPVTYRIAPRASVATTEARPERPAAAEPTLTVRSADPPPAPARVSEVPAFVAAPRPELPSMQRESCTGPTACAVSVDDPTPQSVLDTRAAHQLLLTEADIKDRIERERLHNLRIAELERWRQEDEARLAQYRAEQAAHARSLAQRQADMASQTAEYEQHLRAWHARVRACNAGDRSQCVRPPQ